MKQAFFVSKALCTLTVGLSLTTLSRAQFVVKDYSTEPGLIRYTGIHDRMLQFDVNIPGLPSRSVLRILDEEGNLLYEEYLKTGNFNKRYKVPAGPYGRLHFEVSGRGTRVKQNFNITRQLEERVVVTASL